MRTPALQSQGHADFGHADLRPCGPRHCRPMEHGASRCTQPVGGGGTLPEHAKQLLKNAQ